MDYYEELGINPSATMDEIHRAHRRLSKLLHPDQQTDDAMKLLAETQMRRLNAIVGILSDPELRHQYDDQLKGTAIVPLAASGPGAVRRNDFNQHFGWGWRRLLPWWIWAPLGAVVLTIGVVWFWADDVGSSFSNQTQAYVHPAVQEKAARKNSRGNSNNITSETDKDQNAVNVTSRIGNAPRSPTSNRGVGNGNSPRAKAVRSHLTEPVPVDKSNSLANANGSASPRVLQKNSSETRDTGARPWVVLFAKTDATAVTGIKATETNGTNLPAPPELAVTTAQSGIAAPLIATPLAPAATGAAALNARSQHPLAGEWVYAPKEPEKRKSGLYPPEFIHLKLFWNDGSLHGQYQARYHVTDKPISPDVSFLLSPSDREFRKFIWESSNGTRGTLKIRPVDPGTIHVEWRTTVYSKDPALTAGTATLVRRSP